MMFVSLTDHFVKEVTVCGRSVVVLFETAQRTTSLVAYTSKSTATSL